MVAHTLDAIHSSVQHRRPPTRIQHALTLPTPGTQRLPLRRLHQQHNLHDDLHNPRPARHLCLQSELQASVADEHRGEAAGDGAPLCTRRVATVVGHQRCVAVDHRPVERHRRLLGFRRPLALFGAA